MLQVITSNKCLNDVFRSGAECLVNMTSCTGRFEQSGSSRFFEQFPEYAAWYLDKCNRNLIRPGTCHFYATSTNYPMYIASLPYKRNWHTSIWPTHAVQCLYALKEMIEVTDIQSVALPAIGYRLKPNKWEPIKKAYLDLGAGSVEVFVFSSKKIEM